MGRKEGVALFPGPKLEGGQRKKWRRGRARRWKEGKKRRKKGRGERRGGRGDGHRDGLREVVSSSDQPSHEEKWSGEPSQISWASACTLLRRCHLATFKTFYTKPAQKRYRYSSRDKKFCRCKGSVT